MKKPIIDTISDKVAKKIIACRDKIVNLAIEWEQNPSEVCVKQLEKAVRKYKTIRCGATKKR